MPATLSIMMDITGEVLSDDYPYSLAMSGISTNSKLLIPTDFAISINDLQKAGEFKGLTVPSKELLRVLTSEQSVIRATDFARARGQTQYTNLDEATQAGVIKNNIELAVSLIFKKGSVLKIQSQDYSVYSESLKSWSKTSAKPSFEAKVALFLIKGTKVSFRKQQDLSCSDKRRKLRSSLKNVLNIDIGEPKGNQFVPKRLVKPTTRSSQSRSYRPRIMYPYGYPYGYPYLYPNQSISNPRRPNVSRNPMERVNPTGQTAGRRKSKLTRNRKYRNRTRKLKQRKRKVI